MKMTSEEIAEAIRQEKIGAISIDTNIFNKAQFGFEVGVLSRVRQFAESEIDFVLSDIVLREIKAQLTEAAAESRREYEKATKGLHKGWAKSKHERDELAKGPFGDVTPQMVATERLRSYLSDTSAKMVKASDAVAISDLISMYFKHQPPFANKESKKSEFPDAMALMSLEWWADQQDTIMLVVSEDGDWKSYCETSQRLACVSDLAAALSLFQENSTRYYCAQILKLIEANDEQILGAINIKLAEESDLIEVNAEASSSFRCDVDMTEVEVLNVDSSHVISDLDPIEFDNGVLVARLTLSVPVRVTAHLSFEAWESIDREYMPMGSGTAMTTEEVECEVIITFEGRLPERPQVTDVDPNFRRVHAEFQDVEPDWMSDPDNFRD